MAQADRLADQVRSLAAQCVRQQEDQLVMTETASIAMVAMMWLRLLTKPAICICSSLAPLGVGSPWARTAGFGLLAGDHRALAPQQALEVEDQVVGVLIAVLAVLGHHGLDDHAQAAGELGVEVVGGDDG